MEFVFLLDHFVNFVFTLKIFGRLRAENSKFLDKLQVLNGDMTAGDNLGLNSTDLELFKRSINVVFHSEANVAFNDSITNALNINVLGTRRFLDLCREATQLKVK